MTSDERVPALQWLQNNKNNSAFATNRFGNTQNAIKFVKSLMKAGAEVKISHIYGEESRIKEEGGPYADVLFVYTNDSNRIKIDILMSKSRPDEIDEVEPNVFRLWWD